MKLARILLASTLLLGPLSIISCAVSEKQIFSRGFSQQTSTQGSGLQVEHFTLANGLHVYLTQNKETPRFSARIVVNAGSKHDPRHATGIAHYLEHMLFKGTQDMGTADFAKEKPLLDGIIQLYDQHFQEKDDEKREELQQQINRLSVQASQHAIPGEMDALYARLGAKGLNAYTSDEETVYRVSLPKNRLEQWAMIESNRFAKPVFRLFQSELEIVYEEKNRSMDNKERILGEAVERQLYKKHPYGTQTTLGSVEHLKNPSLTKMYEFYRKYYVPNNMAIIISGDIDIPEAKRIISKYFNAWQKAEIPPFEVAQEDPILGTERVSVNYKGEEKVLLAFRTAPYHSKDREALTMIDMLLDSGEVGLIKLDLVQPQKVRGAGSYPRFDNDYGAQHLYGIPKEGQTLQEVERLLLEQIEKIKNGEFDKKMLKGIVLNFEISLKKGLESNRGRLNIITEAFLKGVPVPHLLSFADRLRRLTKEEIIQAANRYFGNNYVAGYRFDQQQQFPKISRPKLEKVKLNPNQRSPFANSVEAISVKSVKPKWVDYDRDFKVKSFAPGVLLYHVFNPVNDIFHLTISYDYGDKHHENLCYIMDELDFAGVDNQSPEELKMQFFKIGVNADFRCGDYGFSLNLTGLDSQLETALQLSEKVLWSAILDEKRFKARIKNILKSRSDQKKDINTLRRAFNAYIRHGEESGYLDRPTQQELTALTVASYPHMRDQLRKQNFKIYYNGQLPIETVERTVRKYHQPQKIKVPLLNPRKKPELKLKSRHDKPVKIYFLNHKSVQSHISLIAPGEMVDPQERLLNRLYNEYFDGGMGAILFQEVRESRALAYATGARYLQGGRLGDQDQMFGYIGTQADKTVEALKLFIDLLREPPESQAHLERAKKALDNSYRTGYVGFREVLGSVEYWADLGIDRDPRPAEFERLETIQMTDLTAFINEKVSSQNLTFTIVGDKSKIDMAALRKIGDVEEVSIDELFTD